jgi:hypothetical protein
MPARTYPDGTTRHIYGGPGLTETQGDDREFARLYPRIAGFWGVGPRHVQAVSRVRAWLRPGRRMMAP